MKILNLTALSLLLLVSQAQAVTVTVQRTINIDPTVADQTLSEMQEAAKADPRIEVDAENPHYDASFTLTAHRPHKRLSHLSNRVESQVEGGHNVKVTVSITATTLRDYRRPRRVARATREMEAALNELLDEQLKLWNESHSWLAVYEQLSQKEEPGGP
ncbi:MAG: hypothetical protein WBF93_18185 [Pirellulales bacterium]